MLQTLVKLRLRFTTGDLVADPVAAQCVRDGGDLSHLVTRGREQRHREPFMVRVRQGRRGFPGQRERLVEVPGHHHLSPTSAPPRAEGGVEVASALAVPARMSMVTARSVRPAPRRERAVIDCLLPPLPGRHRTTTQQPALVGQCGDEGAQTGVQPGVAAPPGTRGGSSVSGPGRSRPPRSPRADVDAWPGRSGLT